MTAALTRRGLLQLLALFAALPPAAAQETDWRAGLGEPEPFDFDRLTDRAEALAGQPFVPAPVPHAALLEEVDYAAYQRIRYRPEAALWPDTPGLFPVQLFFPGRYFKEPVGIHVV